MFKLKLMFVATLTAVFLTGCNDDDTTFNAPVPSAANGVIRVLHASPDAPAVNVLVNGSQVLGEVPFETGSGDFTLPEGTYSVQVDGIVPGGVATVLGPLDVNLAGNFNLDILAVGSVANIEALAVSSPIVSPPAGSVRVLVIHAASSAPAVDVYVTAPMDELGASAPLGSFSFKDSLTPVVVPAGDYRIRITPAGSSEVAFDSGTVALPADANLVVSAIDNVNPGSSPVKLVVQDGSSSFTIENVNAPATLRVIHNSADSPAVDVVVNDNFESPLIEDLAFPDFTGYVEVPPGAYNVKVTGANNPSLVVIDADLTLDPDEYSVYAMDLFANIQPLVLVDDNRAIATEARVRIVHGSPSAGAVDIYVTAPGVDIANVDPAFTAVPFLADTGYVALAEGNYAVTVTPTGSKVPAIGPAEILLDAGSIYTAVARDAEGGGEPLGLILLDDFNP